MLFCGQQQVAAATSQWLFFDLNKKRITKIPKAVSEPYTAETDEALGADAIDFAVDKAFDPQQTLTMTTREGDYDPNGHVNNAAYLDYLDTLIKRSSMASGIVTQVGIQYFKEITLKELSAPAPFPVQFAQSDGLQIAYCVSGKSAPDLVMSPGIISHLNIMSHFPPMYDTFNAICGFSRVLCFDKRGQGLSDPSIKVPSLDDRIRDIKAVMDQAGMKQAILYGLSEGGPMCLKFWSPPLNIS